VPGQYIRIGLDVDGVRYWRAYSLTSPVDAPDGCISVTVKAIPDGVVSTYVRDRVRPGQLVHLDQATGGFTLPAQRPGKVLFVTAGSGITPVMGMLRNAVHELDDVVLVHSAPTPDDTAGMLDADGLAALVPDLAERETWACGPTGMLDALEQHWDAVGAAERLHTERFRAGIVVVGEGGTVRFTGSGTVVEADAATPILDAGEAAGVLMPSGCRMGICFGCVLPLREGVVRDLRSGDVTTAAPGDGVLIQTCISAAAGPCDIDL
jgi:ferredoxin-NADP reductase